MGFPFWHYRESFIGTTLIMGHSGRALFLLLFPCEVRQSVTLLDRFPAKSVYGSLDLWLGFHGISSEIFHANVRWKEESWDRNNT